jgi:hypothetical protein
MNNKDEENGALGNRLIFTVPVYGFVMALYLDCLGWSNARPFPGKTLPENGQPIEPARIKPQDEDRCSTK